MRRGWLIALGFLALSATGWAMPTTAAKTVLQNLNLGRADEALQSLNSALALNPNDAQARNLRCRVYYEESEWDKAVADCEAAVALDPSDSNDHLWLGRAYGQKASHVSPLAGYKLAHKVRDEFEKAVRLDPQNTAALADLGEFDVRAPGVAGGSLTRAQDLVSRLQPLDPAEALLLQARIDEAKRDNSAAESTLKSAIVASSHPADAWMDLAAFYLHHKRIDDMIAAVNNGAAVDPHHGPALVDGANDLILAHRDLQTAVQWLEEYLSAQAQSELAPSFVVRAELANLLEEQGDQQAAQQEFSAVHSLASGYRVPSLNASAKAGA
ncbi:MAG TPA: tetratricopeptide repeat protein [Acidobacteriaceae bacterium]|nr:tetratricopeptide repeat protein [Acidobacteriaceae bacterium]